MPGLMDRIGITVRGRLAEAKLDPLEDTIRKYILKEFAKNGRPPTTGKIIKGLGLSSIHIVNQTIEKLQKADVLLAKEDNIISAYPFSAIESRKQKRVPPKVLALVPEGSGGSRLFSGSWQE